VEADYLQTLYFVDSNFQAIFNNERKEIVIKEKIDNSNNESK